MTASIPVDLRDDGLLWLINSAVFHPRGYALAVDIDDDGKIQGFALLGDGTEPWRYAVLTDLDVEGGIVEIDDLFARVEACLERARANADTQPELDLGAPA